jgi:hypothetical protein
MKKIRDATIRSILAELDRNLFTKYGFDCEFNKPNGETVCLTFRENPKFQFVVLQDEKRKVWKTVECPGVTFTDSEQYELKGFPGSIIRIKNWVQRIMEELTNGGEDTSKIFEKIRSNLSKKSEELPHPNDPFDEEMATDWQRILDSVVKQFEELKKENKIQQTDLTVLKKEVKELKESIKSVPKKIWFKAAGNRILSTMEKIADSKLAQSLIESSIKGTIKGFIGEGNLKPE